MQVSNNNIALMAYFMREYTRLIREELKSHYISLGVVSTLDGNILMYDSADPLVNNKESCTYQFGIMKNVALGMKKLKNPEQQKQDICEITVNYDGQKHILALSESRKYMVHLILDEDTNLPLTKKYMEKITRKLTQYVVERADSKDFVKKVDFTQQ